MFTKVVTQKDINTVAELAHEIWREHYTPIIGAPQVEYMLAKFQSAPAIAAQIAAQGFFYYLIRHENAAAGYFGYQREDTVMFLSKLYVKKSARGLGLGAHSMDFLRELALRKGMKKIRLTVNKNNKLAIAAYERAGFTRTGAVVTNIGGGYVMDDFAFECAV